MKVISLTTDFGLKDGNVGVMKGVILGIAPNAQIADITHLVPPQDISTAALLLRRSVPYFPPETIHIVVVDPGVGTARRPIAARLGSQLFVCPDNGVLTLLIAYANAHGWPCEFVHLDRPQYWLDEVSHVFHGRDIFAPVGAHLANGKSLSHVGTPIENPVQLTMPQPQKSAQGWRGEVIHIDHFGNIASNLRIEHFPDAYRNPEKIHVKVKGLELSGLQRTFGERAPGEMVILFGSTGSLLVCEVNGNAAERLGIKLGDVFEVWEE